MNERNEEDEKLRKLLKDDAKVRASAGFEMRLKRKISAAAAGGEEKARRSWFGVPAFATSVAALLITGSISYYLLRPSSSPAPARPEEPSPVQPAASAPGSRTSPPPGAPELREMRKEEPEPAYRNEAAVEKDKAAPPAVSAGAAAVDEKKTLDDGSGTAGRRDVRMASPFQKNIPRASESGFQMQAAAPPVPDTASVGDSGKQNAAPRQQQDLQRARKQRGKRPG